MDTQLDITQYLKTSTKFLNWLILIIFSAKVIAAGCFSSGFLNQIFIPFVSTFVTQQVDPWQYFFAMKPDMAFPYPPLMLYILTPFSAFLHFFSISNVYLTNLIFKIPIFVADYIIFYCLYSFRPQSKLLFTVVYLASPIIFFAAYVQGQLDLIPTAFLFISVFWLTRSHVNKAILAFAAALLCKSTAIVALPFLIIFLFRKHNLATAIYFLFTSTCLYITVSLPFILHNSYIQTVFYNPQQNFIFNSGYAIGNLLLLPAVLLMLAIVTHFFLYKKINNDLLLSYLNLAFSFLLIFAYPIPSWFVWVMPYLTLFLVTARKERIEFLTLYAVFCSVYVIFFLFFYEYPLKPEISKLLFLGKSLSIHITSTHARDITFTFLSGMLAIQVYLNYRYSIRSNAIYKNKNHATIIGISGDSGSGKSIFLKDIQALLGHDKATHLEGDGEHRWERGHENWKKHTHLDPKANLLHQQADTLEKLKQGLRTYKRDYDHSTGTFTKAKLVRTNDYILIAGLHPFYLPKARKLIDVKIYLNTDENLRTHWKVLRDNNKRGHSKEQVLQSLEQRMPDRKKFIVPQKNLADLCFRYYTDEPVAIGDEFANPMVKLDVTLSANINLDPIYNLFSQCKDLSFNYDYSEDLQTQEITFSGDISAKEIEQITLKTIPNFDELVGREPAWKSGLQGLRQLLTIIVISHHLKEAM